MASQLKVDTITGVTTAGSVAVTGEGNSTTTNLQQGLSKVNSLGYGGGSQSFAAKDSFNRSGLTDNGTGDYTCSFTNNMNNNEYSFQQSCQSESGVSVASYNLANTLTSSFRQYSFTQHTSPAATDTGMVTLSIFGDLA
tara:strand:- start:66 stop:482 length:417 start_codon:yes stop_codon:yes gene_type:complete